MSVFHSSAAAHIFLLLQIHFSSKLTHGSLRQKKYNTFCLLNNLYKLYVVFSLFVFLNRFWNIALAQLQQHMHHSINGIRKHFKHLLSNPLNPFHHLQIINISAVFKITFFFIYVHCFFSSQYFYEYVILFEYCH